MSRPKVFQAAVLTIVFSCFADTCERFPALLHSGDSFRRGFSKVSSHSYWVELSKGDLLELTAFQEGADVEVHLKAAGLDQDFDSLNLDHGPEHACHIAAHGEVVSIRVNLLGSRTGGAYRLSIVADADASPGRLAAARHLIESERSKPDLFQPGNTNPELSQYDRALRQYGNNFWEWVDLDDVLHQTVVLDRIGGFLQSATESVQSSLDLDLTLRYGHVGLQTWQKLGNLPGELTLLAILSEAYLRLGRPQFAEQLLETGLDLPLEFKPIERARLLVSLGSAKDALSTSESKGGLRKAPPGMSEFDEALKLMHGSQWHRLQGICDRRAHALMRAGDFQGAREGYEAALRYCGPKASCRAIVGANLAELLLKENRPQDAYTIALRSVQTLQALPHRDPVAEPVALRFLARSEQRLGRLHEALEHTKRAVEIIDEDRSAARSTPIRDQLTSSRYPLYELYRDLLLELAEVEPQANYGRLAFEAWEEARLRGVLETISPPPPDFNSTPAGIVSEMWRLLGSQPPYRVGTSHSSFPKVRTMSVEDIQRELIPDKAVLVAFSLGREKSVVWSITPHTLKVHALPDIGEISELAGRYLSALRTSGTDARVARSYGGQLSQVLLRPVSDQIRGTNLVLIIADGALQYIPFADLPIEGERPLVDQARIAYLPSASTIRQIRTRGQQRSASTAFSFFGDPLFEPSSGLARGGSTKVQSTSTASPPLPLPHTRREVSTAARLLSREGAHVMLGADATRENFLSKTTQESRVIHVASHAKQDTGLPELSSILFSQLDERGNSVESALRLHEIGRLHLKADLVVLSACETALGPDIKGEGIMGFPREFIRAGASSVLVSLWNINDEGTADFIEDFYLALSHGQTAAAALQTAQSKAYSAGKSPFFWAGFVLQGDWRTIVAN